ncbi:MAG: hypothetical protein K2X59_03970 [Sphingomonas sp.]|nr:hypothetical protein [Sphingomonas sp.]
MTVFRAILVAIFIVIAGYTLPVTSVHGWNLVPIFVAAIGEMTWQGQFNVDFSCFLILSGLWTAWRSDFSPLGLVLAPVASFGGALFLSAYLLFLTFSLKGDMAAVLLGKDRAAAYNAR